MTIGIIGYGQLSKALLSQKYILDNLLYVVVRDEIKRNIAIQKYPNTKIYSNINEIEKFADLNLILTKDSDLSNVVGILVNHKLLRSISNNHIFAHCSGATNIDVLKPLSELGYPVVKAHPYQTFGFYNESNTDKLFQNVAWLCEVKSKDEKTTKSIISEFITNLNGKTIWKENIINFDERYYHASSIFASNYLNSLIQIVKEFSKLSGIDANTFIYPIMRQTLENNFRIDDDDDDVDKVIKTNFPISGPIARGDLETVKKQIEDIKLLNELNNDTTHASEIDFLKYYKEFGELTAYFCYTNGIFGVDKFEEFKKLFKES